MVGQIYLSADIFDQYRYICIGKLDIGYIGIGWAQIYWYWKIYQLGEYIGIGWTHIGPTITLTNKRDGIYHHEPQRPITGLRISLNKEIKRQT